MTTLPTIHLNGTSADSLYKEYRAVRRAIAAAIYALESATCNARDFYPQDADSSCPWQNACSEREQVFAILIQAFEYAKLWEEHALNHC